MLFCFQVLGQRIYKPNAVLSTAAWYKISVKKSGIFKIDVAFLNSLGINTSSIISNSIRFFGNGGQMLPESNIENRIDDLEENAIMLVDGNDGIFNGNDYFLFYAAGPDNWKKDSVNKRFIHQKNIYSDQSFYFISVGGTGKRISNHPLFNSPNVFINAFSERVFYESDTINLLSSGKEWFGEEFSGSPGKLLSRNFTVNIPGLQMNQPITLISDLIARSVGINSRFDVRINNQLIQQLTIPSVSGGIYDLVAQSAQTTTTSNLSQTGISLSYTYVPGSFNAQGWLNWYELFCRRNLSLNAVDQLMFRDWNTVGNNIGEYIISNAFSTTEVWNITNALQPQKMQGVFLNNEYRFTNSCAQLQEYIAFHPANFLIPTVIGKVENQNLHNSSSADYLIITHASYMSQAQRLALFHFQKNGLSSKIVTTEQVYNEFSSGSPDPVAMRDFIKMYYDKAAGILANQPKYVLLFGDASFDYKNRLANNTNLVPAYQSSSSLDPLATYVSDDFFGFLDNHEDINSGIVVNLLDIGIGRIPAKNLDEAKNYIDKVEAYHAKESFGPWRNDFMFIADDEDQNLHLQDAEIITQTASVTNPLFNTQKVYLDAFKQESGSAGGRYPTANAVVNNGIFNGALIWNYNGHGGPFRLAEEVILDQEIINKWNNPYRLPLFITATCDFAPYDNPTIKSIGEDLLLRPKTGSIALMTTTRLVFAFSNRIMNENYLKSALQKDAKGNYKTLGKAIQDAKNFTYQNSGDIINNRKFTLLGDPALTLAFPKMNVAVEKVNGQIITASKDTLKSSDKVIVEGSIKDPSGNVVSNFNGTVYGTVYDKVQSISTLGNDPGSQPVSFQVQNSVLFKGKSTAVNGLFTMTFKMPADINFQFGNGKMSWYADNETVDASGLFTDFIVGGSGINKSLDKEGPVIKAWLNDEKFVNGSVTNQNPIVIVQLSDSSGINTSGIAVNHDIVATLDNDNKKYFVLNDFYVSDLDSYQKGKIRFQLPQLEPGPHMLKIKAWDLVNNSNEQVLDFVVANDEKLIIKNVLNYPNPFTTNTQFWFEHNKPGQNLLLTVQIFTISGRLIKSFKKTINTPGNRFCELEWNGRDEFSENIAKGIYIYKLSIKDEQGNRQEKIEKLLKF